MEMSVGTIVTIVLLMSVLILGIFLVQKIFGSATNAIDSVDRKVNDEINKLFTDDGEKKLVVFPERPVLKKGKTGGVGISIRNTGQTSETYNYVVVWESDDCNFGKNRAEDLIALGDTGVGISLSSGSSMDSAKDLRFRISEETPLCLIRYTLTVFQSNGDTYTQKDIDLEIK